MTKGPIDFAIVTALKVERDSIVSRLENVQEIQEPDDPHTYYLGHVTIPTRGERYAVVAVMLLGMGNDNAATTTTRLLHRWQPTHVLTVGIAGGVQAKVALGDVVVGDYVHYYEVAKLTSSGEERRPQQFPSSRMLFGRALAFEADDWRAAIGIERPDASSATVLPAVHFGPVASGEKVIADESSLQRLLRECPKLLAVAMEGAGVARAGAYYEPAASVLEIRGVSDFTDSHKDDRWQRYAANAAASFAIGLLRSGPVEPRQPKEPSLASKVPGLMILCVQSLRRIRSDELLNALGDEVGRPEHLIVSLDFTDLVAGGELIDPTAAARRLADPQSALHAALARLGESELAFHGLVHVPLAILAGYLVTDRQPVRLFDFHHDRAGDTWTWPAGNEEFPPLGVQGLPESVVTSTDPVVVRVSVSYPVLVEQTRAVIKDAALEIDLTLPQPERSIIRSEKQVREYGRIFRRLLDLLARRMPATGHVHLFYAGPVALAFHLGQQISPSIHPPVVAWNYRRRYDWAIDLSAAALGESCVISATSA